MVNSLKLHIGCGNRYLSGFTHIDIIDYKHVDIITEAHKLPTIDSGSVDLIYASHILEHYSRADTENLLLREWNRVLKLGGVLRLAVPNFDSITKLYRSGTDLCQLVGPLYGTLGSTNNWEYHKTVYDESSLTAILVASGFSAVNRWDWRKTHPEEFDDFSKAYIPHMDFDNGTSISLNLEAIKV